MAEKFARQKLKRTLTTQSSLDQSVNVSKKEVNETEGLLLGFMRVMVNKDSEMSTDQAKVMSEALARVEGQNKRASTDSKEENYDDIPVQIGQQLAGVANEISRKGGEEVDAVVSDLLGTPSLAYKMFVNIAMKMVEWRDSGVGESSYRDGLANVFVCGCTLCVHR